MFIFVVRPAVVLLVCLLIAGCGAGDKLARYKVEGHVTFRSQPVEEGTITFGTPETGQVDSAELSKGGTYSVMLPAGQYKVSVSPPLVETKGTGDSPPDLVPKKVANIPKKFWVQETSGLTAEVDQGKQKFDFDLGGGAAAAAK
jgi:hypothetical protein